MNIDYYVVDKNTFVILNDKGEKITYTTYNDINNLDAFTFAFLQNQLEYKENVISKLLFDKKITKSSLLHLKKSISRMKKINNEIKRTKKDIGGINKQIEMISSNINVTVVSNDVKKISRKNK